MDSPGTEVIVVMHTPDSQTQPRRRTAITIGSFRKVDSQSCITKDFLA